MILKNIIKTHICVFIIFFLNKKNFLFSLCQEGIFIHFKYWISIKTSGKIENMLSFKNIINKIIFLQENKKSLTIFTDFIYLLK
jgi:hypothetical protein